MIYFKENFITRKVAAEIIKLSENLFTPATVLGSSQDNYRIAESAWLNKETEIIHSILKRIAKITGLSICNQEAPNVIKYNIGGEFKTHHDFFHPHQDYTDECLNRGGQRTKTALLYLNDGFAGGNTVFPYYDLTITPKTGKLVIWNNLNEDGSLNMESLHAGQPVESGVKYVLAIWIRENPFVHDTNATKND